MEVGKLIVNIGSSSKKYALYQGDECVLFCHYEHDHTGYMLTIEERDSRREEQVPQEIFDRAIFHFLEYKESAHRELSIEGVGIRVVAPGDFFAHHRVIDDEYVTRLGEMLHYAPLHITSVLEEMKKIREALPYTQFIAASDSAFHRTLPLIAKKYGLSFDLCEKFGIERFGYHGLSVASVVKTLTEHLGSFPKRTVVLHLGSGCSATALLDGVSIDTSMGFTPLEGLIMSSRAGSFDPSVLFALLRNGMSQEDIERIANKESGLLGLSGSTSDMREIIEKVKAGEEKATQALSVFVYTIAKYIGAYSVVLGGVDAVVFTGTIGERSFFVREKILSLLPQKIAVLHQEHNTTVIGGDHQVACISDFSSPAALYVVPTDEASSILSAMTSIS